MDMRQWDDRNEQTKHWSVRHSMTTVTPGERERRQRRTPHYLQPFISRRLTSTRQRRNRKKVMAMLPDILAACDANAPGLGAEKWIVQHIHPTEPDMVAAAIGPPEERAVAVLIIPRNEHRKSQLARRIKVKQDLEGIPGIHELRKVMPRDLTFDITSEQPYLLQEHLPGVKLGELKMDDAAYTRAQRAALRTISELHRETATEVHIGEKHLRWWVSEPLHLIKEGLQIAGKRNDEDAAAIRLIEQHLQEVLTRQPVVVSWVHGDFWEDNILVSATSTDVTGIVDWEWAACGALPSFDIVNLLLSRRWIMSGGEWGDAIIDVLRAGEWTAAEYALFNACAFNGSSQRLGTRTLVLLGWLWHIRCNLPRTRRHFLHRRWFAHNVTNVLREVRGGISLE